MRIDGKNWERHRRGRHAVFLCPGMHLRDVRERCPYQIVQAEPGDPTQDEAVRAAAEKHWSENHAGSWGDHWRANVAGQLERTGLIGR